LAELFLQVHDWHQKSYVGQLRRVERGRIWVQLRISYPDQASLEVLELCGLEADFTGCRQGGFLKGWESLWGRKRLPALFTTWSRFPKNLNRNAGH
jgi:hypothetical protein